MHEPILITIQQQIIQWFRLNKRSLPWRETSDPYSIWVSEIILQQTRVNQGLEYYRRFVETFPTVDVLAAANETEVLKQWQGLGYYSRARNMHFAAKQIMSDFNGQFPSTYAQIVTLKGVGDYTASAISSIAFGEQQAVVDGNVIRVLARIFGIADAIGSGLANRKFKEMATMLLAGAEPGEFNQAIMEFGALQCVPQQPRCPDCPLRNICYAVEKGRVSELPAKKSPAKQRQRFFVYVAVVSRNGETIVYKRSQSDVWKGLFEFPLYELNEIPDDDQLMQLVDSVEWIGDDRSIEFGQSMYKHVLSHQIINARFVILRGDIVDPIPGHFIKIPLPDIRSYPVSRLTEKFINDNNEIFQEPERANS